MSEKLDEKQNIVRKDHLNIGETIRFFRKQKGYTLTQLADMCELSPSFISLAERGKATPSITSLVNMANALEVDVNEFLTPPPSSDGIHYANKPQYIDLDSPVTYISLSGAMRNQIMGVLLMVVPAGFRFPTRRKKNSETFYCVQEGRVTFVEGDSEYILESGDSVHFKVQQPYTLYCDADQGARVLVVETPPLFDQQ